jgi:imidazolonepropionase-like amidohydrolase
MVMRRSILCVGLTICLITSQAALGQTTAIRAGRLIDPATGAVAQNHIILISAGRIIGVGGNIDASGADRIIDLSTSWVVPGLMDAHVHLTLNQAPQMMLEAAYLTESTALRALRGLRNAQFVLEAGFTTVKDIGNSAEYAARDLRRAIEMEWYAGPTILDAGKIIAPFGGQSHGIPPEQLEFWQYEYIDADTPDEIRKAVRRNIYYGANTIKLVSDNSVYYYTEEEIRAAVTEAHNAGLSMAVHVMGGDAARNVIPGGADAIELGFGLSDELLTLMKEHGTVLVGTDFPGNHLAAMGFPGAVETGDLIVDRLARAHRLGVKMAFGTDVVMNLPGMNRGEMGLDYLRVWERAGIPAADILKAMTTNAAELFQIQHERGAIAVGQWADLVATPENPLEDIQALQNVHFVMKNGQVVKHQ